ncbi:MAG: hypothetical protein LBB34_03735, partial [Holosporales bacterium]|nr:hypothetical protein [Holosporales bacterium]
ALFFFDLLFSLRFLKISFISASLTFKSLSCFCASATYLEATGCPGFRIEGKGLPSTHCF